MRLEILTEDAFPASRRDGARSAPRAINDGAIKPLEPCSAATLPWRAALDRYLAAWAEANPIKIIQATAPGYRLDDPLVGLFSRWSVPRYFELLQARLAATGAAIQADFAFLLRGPMHGSTSRLGLQFWREAPRIGLTGIAEIKVGERGVIGETVAYDLNLASDLLRRRTADRGQTTDGGW